MAQLNPIANSKLINHVCYKKYIFKLWEGIVGDI
jgi:hypothetical protein